MSFLNCQGQKRKKMMYELYFKEKFHSDCLYPAPKGYLAEAVSKHIKPVDYDRWSKLYWKKQIEGNLTEEEQKELEKPEKENMKTVVEVYKALKKRCENQGINRKDEIP